LEARILEQFPQADIGLVRGAGGVFDVTVDDQLIYSKHQTGRFPEELEILDQIGRA